MYTPYPHQNEAVDSIFHYYAKGSVGNPLVAMPTATGKSLVIAEFIKKVLMRWPRQRFLLATHVKELIVQNAEKIRSQWQDVPLGILSAGLNQRDTHHPVIYGGIGTIVGCVEQLGWRDLMLVDEAHLISPDEDTMYQEVIKRLRAINPHMRVIGFTATPYRLKQGMLTDEGIFTDICYDITSLDEFNKLIDGGYLVAPVPKRMHTALDTSNVGLTAGEFNQGELQAAVDKDQVTYAACRESVEEGYDRQCWLAFASGIKHAEHVASVLQSLGIDAVAVHSKMPMKLADERLAAFKAGQIKCVVNYGKLTTGFDHPPIDLIIMLRPTMSTVLWVQMIGRGTRPSTATHKENCLVLDFARNTERLGPINDPVIPRKRKKGDEPGVAPIRICPKCGVYNHARAVKCFSCGYEFPKIQKLVNTAGTAELIRRQVEPVVQKFNVERVFYNKRQRPGQPAMIQVQYCCGLQMFSKWISLESKHAYAKQVAAGWWQEAMGSKIAPPTTAEAMMWVSRLRQPRTITVHINKKYPEVLAAEY